MKKIKYDKLSVFKYVVLVYFILSPLFDLTFVYNHLTTMIRIAFLLAFCAVTLILSEKSRKKVLYLLAFYLAMLVYFLLAFFHSKGFTSFIPGLEFNLVSEASTLLKLAMPFTILFIMKYLDVSKKEFLFVINSWIVLIAGSIVLTNLIGYSLSSYTNEITRYSIFSWGSSLSVNESATKGFFMYANQVSIVLLILLIMSFYETIFVNKKYSAFFALAMISMWMVGTRVSTYGGLLVAIFLIILYIGYSFWKKCPVEKVVLIPTILVSIWCVVLPITPCNARVLEIEDAKSGQLDRQQDSEVGVSLVTVENTDITDDEDLAYIETNINKNTIGEQFYLEYYPYKYDMDFWNDVIELQKTNYVDYRKIELLIIGRIWEIDGRWNDYVLGISNSVIQKVTNIERDFVLQFYAFGILGTTVVLSFYVYMIIVAVKKTLTDFNFINISISCILAVFMFASFMTGNSLHFLATIVPVSFVLSFIGKYNDC